MICHLSPRGVIAIVATVLLALQVAPAEGEQPAESATNEGKVSYHKQVRPILKAHCQGCHQPAKAGGDYTMTDFAALLQGGESESAAIAPGSPDDSYLMMMITPFDGEAEMPRGKKPLADSEIELIRNWIAQGAHDDTPPSTRVPVDADHPPVYTRPPVVTSLDFSSDGNYLAVAGYHEVLMYSVNGSQADNSEAVVPQLAARLIGLSQRIESVRFSPDGKLLAATGGAPGETGEVQIWDVATRELKLSVPVSYDTLYGAKWSPDGKLVSFGGGDNIVRAIEVETGEEVLFQGAHDDWVLDTTFNAKGTHVISVSRDRSVKLTELKTERFVDNITSITPGALKGGVAAVESHPQRDEILVGGADGTPKLYRVFRQSARKIGDDANLIRTFPTLRGRVFDVAIAADGSRIAASSGLDGSGEVRVFAYDFDTNLPGDVKKIMEKRSYQRSAAEKQKLDAYRRDGVRIQAEAQFEKSAIYAIAFSADGKRLAASGSDGTVRLLDAATGEVTGSFPAAPIAEANDLAQQQKSREGEQAKLVRRPQPSVSEKKLPEGTQIVSLEVEPQEATITGKYNAVQFVVTGHTADGSTLDLTRMAEVKASSDAVDINDRRLARLSANGDFVVTFGVPGHVATAKLSGREIEGEVHPDYIQDIRPVMTRMGCNQGTCHGANKGKNGFKLSLRGNDAIFDLRALTDDHKSRRVNLASPENSLMLLKSTSTVPHEGGQVTREGEPYYQLMKLWIADGAKLDMTGPKVENISIFPPKPIIDMPGQQQQFRVLARFTDGTTRDVTAESFISVSDIELASTDGAGLFTASRRGEAAILARYEGAFAAAPITVMGNRKGFVWKQPEAYNFIDEMVYAKQKRVKTLPSGLCTDAEFIRRIYLDLTGLPPTAEQVEAFLADETDTRQKREALIDQLIGSEQYVEYWTNKWADLLQVNGKFLAREGATAFRKWIREQVAANKPYDEFAYDVLTASGSNREHPAASYYKITRTPADTMENTTHLFLAIRFNCNKCHDHPFERWTQDQYYETAAYFAQFDLKKDPKSGKKTIGKSAVDSGKPLYEIVSDTGKGEMIHDRTGEVAPPQFPYPVEHEEPADASRREQLASWITSPNNQYFARSYVNRVWGYLTGTGLIEPLDDIRAGNPPSNPRLLDQLTQEFISSDFNVRELMRTICKSRTYQLSIDTNKWNAEDTLNYAHAKARRLPAEVLYDTLHRVTGTTANFPGVPVGTRAAALPDVGIKMPSGFLNKFGRPARESACECERSDSMQLGPIMALISGPVVDSAITSDSSEIARLAQSSIGDRELVNEIFLRVLNRPATEQELHASVALIGSLPERHEQLVAQLQAYEDQLSAEIKQKEADRLARIEQARQAVTAREQEIAEQVAADQKARQARIATAAKELKQYEAGLAEKLFAWEQQREKKTIWQPLVASDMTSDMNAKFTQGDDKSIVVTGGTKIGQYVITMPTEARGITAIRLEALADKQFPKSGPGRAPNDGNFVVTELELTAAASDSPEEQSPVKLTGAQADFSQKSYDVATAIDGKLAPQGNGWAIAPEMGKNHVAAFQLAEPLDQQAGSILTIALKQHYQSGKHTLGRFRISVTTSTEPIVLEKLPGEVAKLLELPAEKRNAKQKQQLLDYYKSVDVTLKQLQEKLAQEKQPLPTDPRLVELRNELTAAQKPSPVDPQWAQLQADVELSKQQLNHQRVTAAQDIVWALVNSPAFLFNR